MKHTSVITGVLFVLAAAAVGYLLLEKQTAPSTESPSVSFKDATYTIDGNSITLVNGLAQSEAAPGSASKLTTRYFGNEATGDLNGDGLDDVAFVLTQEGGGSGTFFYVVAALKTTSGWQGSDAVFLGDRIAPQTTQINNGTIVVNYAERKKGEPMTTAPSEGKSLVLKLDPTGMQLGEVVQNFEGEADASRMSLTMKRWQWVTARIDNTTVTPKFPEKFLLSFKAQNEFSASTDCNGVGGSYNTKSASLSFDKMMSTMMFCDGSQEGVFTKILSDTTGYHFTSKGELVLELANGTATFK